MTAEISDRGVASGAALTPAPVYVHIHAPQPNAFGISRVECPTCKKRSYSVWRFTEWYGSDSTCMRCGEEWTDEGRCARPFAPGWRKKNIDAARKLWKRLSGTVQTPKAETK